MLCRLRDHLAQLGLKSLVIACPSLLDGNRAALGQPKRGGEGLGLWLARRLRLLLPVNYRAVLAKDVVHALIQAVQAANPGIVTLLSGDMHDHRQRQPLWSTGFFICQLVQYIAGSTLSKSGCDGDQ